MLQKVAALIWYENRVLLWPCSNKKAHAPLWGFVGGAVVSGETRQETLIRICREALGITLSVGDVFSETACERDGTMVHTTLFNAVHVSGAFSEAVYQQLLVIPPDEIADYPLCPEASDLLKSWRCPREPQALQHAPDSSAPLTNRKFKINVVAAQTSGINTINAVREQLLAIKTAQIELILTPDHLTAPYYTYPPTPHVTAIERYKYPSYYMGRGEGNFLKTRALSLQAGLFTRLFQSADVNIFVGGFSLYESITVHLCALAHYAHCRSIVLGSLPFKFEGIRAKKAALSSANCARQYAEEVLAPDAEGLRPLYGKTLTLATAFSLLDNALGVWLLQLCSAKSMPELLAAAQHIKADLPVVDEQEISNASLDDFIHMDPCPRK
ncbi:MAG: NUDIX domain-containing protein [Ruthenibacterium sp.]